MSPKKQRKKRQRNKNNCAGKFSGAEMFKTMKKKIIILVFLIFWAAVFTLVYRYSIKDRVEIRYQRSTETIEEEEF